MSDNEELLFELKINKGASQADVDAYTKSIEVLIAENKDLIAIQNELKKSGDVLSQQYLENAKTIEINKQKLAEDTTARKALITVLNTEEGATKQLTASNKLLIIERNKLSDSTETGKKKIDDINKLLDVNNAKIKENVSGQEKQRINIGNYKSALDGVVPGLGGLITGIEGATKAGLAFIATPVGLVLAAIGVALAALSAYFKGSESAQNDFNKIMSVGSVVMERFQDLLEAIGGAIAKIPALFQAFYTNAKSVFERFETAFKIAFFPITIAIEQIKFLASTFQKFFPETAAQIEKFFKDSLAAVKKYAADIADDAQKLADLQITITRKERDLEVQRAQTRLQTAQIRKEADESEGQARLDLVTKAIALDNQLLQSELSLSKAKLQLAEENRRIKGDDIAANDAVAKAQAEVYNQEANFLEGTRRNNKERVSLEQELAKAAKDKSDLMSRLGKQHVIDTKEELEQEADLRALDGETQDTAAQAAFEKRLKESSDLLYAKTTNEEAYTIAHSIELAKQDQAEKIKREGMLNGIQSVLLQASLLFKKNTQAYKIVASAETGMNTAKAAMAAYASASETPVIGWLLGPLAAGLAIAYGAIQIARINGIQFARGGRAWGTTLGGSPHGAGGTKFWGSDGTRFEAEEGEGLYVLKRDAHQDLIRNLSKRNERFGGVSWSESSRVQHAALGGSITMGPSIRTNDIAAMAAATADSVLKNQPPIFVAVEDINRAQTDKDNLIRRANVL